MGVRGPRNAADISRRQKHRQVLGLVISAPDIMYTALVASEQLD